MSERSELFFPEEKHTPPPSPPPQLNGKDPKHNPAPTTKRIGAQPQPRPSPPPRPQSPLLRPPHPEPRDKRNHRNRRNNQSSQRINLRRHPHPHRREHHHRQSRRPRPGHKARNHQIIQRQSKRQQPARHQRRRNHRQGNHKERLQRRTTQIHGRFLNGQIHLPQPRTHHHRHIGTAEGRVSNPDRRHTPIHRPANQLRHLHKQQQQRQTGDHFRHHQRRRDHARQQRAPAHLLEPGNHKGTQGAQTHRHAGGVEGNAQAHPHGRQNLLISEQRAVPLGGKAGPHRDQPRGVEGIHNQHHHRQVQEQHAQHQHGFGETGSS